MGAAAGGVWERRGATPWTRSIGCLGRPGKLLQDLLNGSWLGHSLHPVVVDVVVGRPTAAVLLAGPQLVFGVDGLATAATCGAGADLAGRPLGASSAA